MTCPLCKHENAPDADRCANCLIRFAPKAKSELDEALDLIAALAKEIDHHERDYHHITNKDATAKVRAILAKHGRLSDA